MPSKTTPPASTATPLTTPTQSTPSKLSDTASTTEQNTGSCATRGARSGAWTDSSKCVGASIILQLRVRGHGPCRRILGHLSRKTTRRRRRRKITLRMIRLFMSSRSHSTREVWVRNSCLRGMHAGSRKGSGRTVRRRTSRMRGTWSHRRTCPRRLTGGIGMGRTTFRGRLTSMCRGTVAHAGVWERPQLSLIASTS